MDQSTSDQSARAGNSRFYVSLEPEDYLRARNITSARNYSPARAPENSSREMSSQFTDSLEYERYVSPWRRVRNIILGSNYLRSRAPKHSSREVSSQFYDSLEPEQYYVSPRERARNIISTPSREERAAEASSKFYVSLEDDKGQNLSPADLTLPGENEVWLPRFTSTPINVPNKHANVRSPTAKVRSPKVRLSPLRSPEQSAREVGSQYYDSIEPESYVSPRERARNIIYAPSPGDVLTEMSPEIQDPLYFTQDPQYSNINYVDARTPTPLPRTPSPRARSPSLRRDVRPAELLCDNCRRKNAQDIILPGVFSPLRTPEHSSGEVSQQFYDSLEPEQYYVSPREGARNYISTPSRAPKHTSGEFSPQFYDSLEPEQYYISPREGARNIISTPSRWPTEFSGNKDFSIRKWYYERKREEEDRERQALLKRPFEISEGDDAVFYDDFIMINSFPGENQFKFSEGDDEVFYDDVEERHSSCAARGEHENSSSLSENQFEFSEGEDDVFYDNAGNGSSPSSSNRRRWYG